MEQGEVLLSLALALAVIAALSAAYLNWKHTQNRETAAMRTAEGIALIQEALYSYRLNPDHGYAWPAAIGDLEIYIPNFAGGGRNGVGQPYSLVAVTPATPTSGITIETNLLTAEAAEDVRRLFPVSGAVSGTSVRVGVPVPGHEAAREAMLPRDGLRDMEGNLDMGGNEIANVDQMTLDGEVFTGTAVKFIQDLSGLNCSGTQRVRVVSGTPSCVSTGSSSPGPSPNPSPSPSPSPPPPSPDPDPDPDPPTQLQCPPDDPRPASLNSRASWSCRSELDNNGACVKVCKSSCGSGDRAGTPRYYCHNGGWGATCDECNSYVSGCSPQGSYSTDAGTCWSSSCRYQCRGVR